MWVSCLNPGSGKSVLAFLVEDGRAVAIAKNKTHNDFIMQGLVAAVKGNNLAPDGRP